MSLTYRKEVWYPHSPEKVWVAITDPRAIAEWLMPNNFKPVVGHQFRYQVDPMPGCGHMTVCEVVECDPPKRLSYTWTHQASKPMSGKPGGKPCLPTRVCWTLTPEGHGTRLVFEHHDLQHIVWWQRLMMRFGWGTMHKRWIPKILARVSEAGVFTPGAIPLKKRCYKTKTLPNDLIW